MSIHADIPTVAIQVSRDLVVASIQVELAEDVLARFREDLLQRVHASDTRGVILDLSGLEVLDSHELASLRGIMDMVTIMGVSSVVVGLRPGVVSSLMEAGADVDGLSAAIDLDAAFDLFEQPVPVDPQLESATGESAEGSPSIADLAGQGALPADG